MVPSDGLWTWQSVAWSLLSCKVEISQVHKSRMNETEIALYGMCSFEEGENYYNMLVLARAGIDVFESLSLGSTA